MEDFLYFFTFQDPSITWVVLGITLLGIGSGHGALRGRGSGRQCNRPGYAGSWQQTHSLLPSGSRK